jgi:predicted phosphodiesterase
LVRWRNSAISVQAVIYGHSHQPKIETKNGTLFFNPGSAGPRRFHLPITVGRMTALMNAWVPARAASWI